MQSYKYLAAVPMIAAAAVAAPATAAPKAAKTADFVRQAPLPAWAVAPLRAAASAKTDPVVELVAESQMWIGGDSNATLYNRAVQVNDQSALAQIGQYSLSYVPAYQRLLIHRVAILRKGQLIDLTASVNIRALDREQGLENGVYGGAKTMQMLLRDVRVGDVLWVSYTVEGDNPVFGGKVNRVVAWDSDVPVEQRRLILIHPRKRPVEWAQLSDFNAAKLEPRVEQLGDNVRLTFEGKDLAAVEGEASMPAEYLPSKLLQFSEYGEWQGVAQWAAALFESPRANPSLVALADSLDKGGSPMERATAALRWVQDEVRYFSVSIGENSHRPQLPEVVLRNRYGDCKDKSRLLVALLRQMGIEAKPVLVSAFAPRIAPRVKPSPFWFDHVIVRVTLDGHEYFVDPTQTGQTESIADLPPALAGGSGLVVDAATAALVTIPADRSDTPQFELNEAISVPEFNGAGTLLAKRYYRGAFAASARRHFSSLSQAMQRKWALELYEKQYPGVTLLEAPVVSEAAGRFVMTARFSLPKPIEYKDKLYKIAYDTRIMEDSLGIPPKIARDYPFEPTYGKYHSRYRLTMEWPKSLRINNLPSGRQVESPYIQAHEDYISRGNFLDYELDYRIKQDRIPAADMPALHETSKQLQEFASGSFRVNSDQVSQPEAAGFSYRNLELAASWDSIRQRARNVMGKKADQISLNDACDYAADFFAIEETLPQRGYGEGSALRSMLLGKKGEAKAIDCVPFTLLIGGDAAGALAVTSGQTLADDSPYLSQQATARWMTGDLAGAAADMGRYYKARVASGQVNGFDALRLLTLLQRAGQPVPDELLGRAKANPQGPWPMPLLAMQAGVLAPVEVEAIAKAMPRDAADMALNDYWLQVGEMALAAGDQQAARRAFAWFKSNGIRSFTPNLIAQAEAARLVESDPDVKLATQAFAAGKKEEALRILQKAADAGSRDAQYGLALLNLDGKYLPRDEAKATQLFMAAARLGLPEAQNELARMYAMGQGIVKDEKLAAEWFAKGAENGDYYALHNLATRYAWGDAVPRDPARAAALMRESAEMGYGEAQGRLASYYREGFGVSADFEQARFWAVRAAQQNDPRGLYELGMLLRDGHGTKRDPAAAVEMIRKAADLGFDEAQLEAGFELETGRHVKQDLPNALKYYRLGAEHGHGGSMMRLGRMYLYGIGVKVDQAEARAWVVKAHEKHVPHATYLLAEMMYNGWGGEADVPGAIAMWKENAETWAQSAFSLGQVYHFGSKVAQNAELALKYYGMAVSQEYGPALNNLGDMYENGLGVEQSYPKAIELYQRAARQEDGTAFLSLASLFADGHGVSKDTRLAYIYILLAEKMNGGHLSKQRDLLARQLPAEVRAEADQFAAAWTVQNPLPGLSEASASPAGQE